MRIHGLKPFKLETDALRNFDILRAYLIEKRLLSFPNEVPSVIDMRITRVRQDTSAIYRLREEFPIIDHESIHDFATKYDLKFEFYYRKNSRVDFQNVHRIGNGKTVIHLSVRKFNTVSDLSFCTMSLLREMHKPATVCNYLKSKIRHCYSILDAFRHAKNFNLTEEEFFQDWGTLEIKFNQLRSFAKLYKVGIEVWSDEENPSRLRTAYIEPKIVILVNQKIRSKMSIHVHDEIKLVLDPNYLRVHLCSKCFKDFKSKYHLTRHEKACEKGTNYTFKEKKYGANTENTRSRLIRKGILKIDEPSLYNFVSFDIESLNVPVTSTNSNRVIRFKQEVNRTGLI